MKKVLKAALPLMFLLVNFFITGCVRDYARGILARRIETAIYNVQFGPTLEGFLYPRNIGKNVELQVENGLYIVTIRMISDMHELVRGLNINKGDDFLTRLYAQAYGYGFGRYEVKGKIDKIIIQAYNRRYHEKKYDKYGNIISPAYKEAKLSGIITLRKGNADKFNWTTIENKYGDFYLHIKEEVKKNISTKAVQGEWFIVRTYND